MRWAVLFALALLAGCGSSHNQPPGDAAIDTTFRDSGVGLDASRRLAECARLTRRGPPGYDAVVHSLARPRSDPRALLLATLLHVGACSADQALPTRRAEVPEAEICEDAWGSELARRADMPSLPPRSQAQNVAARPVFLEDCRALPRGVQRCLVTGYSERRPDICPPGAAQERLRDVWRRRCPRYQTLETCLEANCAWSNVDYRCVPH